MFDRFALAVIRKQTMGAKTLGKSYNTEVKTLSQRTTDIRRA